MTSYCFAQASANVPQVKSLAPNGEGGLRRTTSHIDLAKSNSIRAQGHRALWFLLTEQYKGKKYVCPEIESLLVDVVKG